MIKYILLNSPIFWDATKENEEYLPPLGLGYIATYLEKAGIEVKIIDCVKGNKAVDDIVTLIDAELPDFFGINIFTQNYDIVKFILENISIECEFFVGGQVVKNIYNDIFSWNVKNKLNIIIGEGEFIIPQIVLGECKELPIKQNANKAVYKVDKNSKYFPRDISNISLNRNYLGNEIVINHYGDKEAAIITSRGCMYNCAFCGGAKSINEDITLRIRTEESVVNEIEEILELYRNVKSIRILDDLFLRNSKSIDMAIRIFIDFPQLSWRGMVHVLSLSKTINRIKDLRKSRCKELFIGIESGSEFMRNKINKAGSICDIIKVSREILENGIDLKGYFIFGFPKETQKDFADTYNLACELKEISLNTPGTFRTSVFQFRPYHGTQLYNEIVADTGIIHACQFNDSISQFEGRSQFNFNFGNYSLESDDLLNDYIIKTQKLSEE
ncbi:B12-binding domain-containing radical SAM protein [Lachnotalea glycerini]|nr:radical SAM protein [Lachnotalea glycerini]